MLIYSAIAVLLTLIYVLLFLFYLIGWNLLPAFSKKRSNHETKVSIIIPARNEEASIADLLRSLVHQSYPREMFEVLVVDDFSEDATANIVRSFAENNFHLLQSSAPGDSNNISHKKRAIETGISCSTGELLITTDADCTMDSLWLETIVNFYEETRCSMIVAPVLIKQEDNFFHRLIQLDLIGMAGITGATLHNNFPTMCNGANLAFRKSSFVEVGGYNGIDTIASGDDMLLMHKFAKQFPDEVLFLKNQDAVVFSIPPFSLKHFFQQRMRWTSKSKYYSDWKIKANLLAVYLFNCSLMLSLILSLINSSFLLLFFFQLLAKWVADFAFLAGVSYFFKRRKWLWLFLPAEIFHIFYIIIVGFAGNFLTTTWKGRTVK